MHVYVHVHGHGPLAKDAALEALDQNDHDGCPVDGGQPSGVLTGVWGWPAQLGSTTEAEGTGTY